MKGFSSARFDLNNHAEVRKILVLASSYRCGSTLVSTALWETGQCGAPWEYFNYENVVDVFKARLGVTEIDEYIDALMRVRTTSNGVFSVKAHSYHFSDVWGRSARWRSFSDQMRFVYINRRNKVAQAVSMAKALQDNAWSAFMDARQVPLFYSSDLIKRCLEEIMSQSETWWNWFNENSIEPFVVDYDEFVHDQAAGVDAIVQWLGLDVHSNQKLSIPTLERQSNGINIDWEQRFVADMAKMGT